MNINKKVLFVAILGLTIYSLALNEWNRYTIFKKNPGNKLENTRSLVYGSTIYSIDNYWYVSQIKNYKIGNGFTIDPSKYNYTVRRTPVYPVFYGIHFLLFGEEASYFYIRFTQIAIFILATIALLYATFNFTKSKTIAIITALLYGFNPTLVSYLYFTITEALSPSLVCFILYFLSLCVSKGRKTDWILAGFFFALGSLCRPTLFIFGGAVVFLLLFLYLNNVKRILQSSILFGCGLSILFIPYLIRNYLITNNEIILLEKYYKDPMDFGLPNMELRHWISCWKNPADYSSENISSKIIINITSDTGIPKEEFLINELNTLPNEAFLVNKKTEVANAYNTLYDYFAVKSNSTDSILIDSVEQISIKRISSLTKSFIEKKPLQYYVITPLQIIKSVIVQSNSSVISLLDNYKGNPIKISIKIYLLLLNIFLFISLIGLLFFIKPYKAIYGIVFIFSMVNILFITFYYRYIEARYLIPLFPGMYILASTFGIEVIRKLRSKLHF